MPPKKLYLQRGTRKSREDQRGLLWIVVTIMLIFLVVPLLWNYNPFRSHQVNRISSKKDGNATKTQNILVTAPIPKSSVTPIKKPQKTQDEELEETTVSATSEQSGGTQSNKDIGDKSVGQMPDPGEIAKTPLNPYQLAEEAAQRRKALEEKPRTTVAHEGLEEAISILDKVEPKSSQDQQSTQTIHDMYSMLKKSHSPDKTTSMPKNMAKGSSQPSPSSLPGSTNISPNYWIQVGAYTQKNNALAIKDRLEKMGYTVVVKETSHATLGELYLARIPFNGSYNEAQDVTKKLQQILGSKPLIVRIR